MEKTEEGIRWDKKAVEGRDREEDEAEKPVGFKSVRSDFYITINRQYSIRVLFSRIPETLGVRKY